MLACEVELLGGYMGETLARLKSVPTEPAAAQFIEFPFYLLWSAVDRDYWAAA